jgi:hypothetical protein
MVARNIMSETGLAHAFYDIFDGDKSPVPDLLYRMCVSYVSSMSDDAFRDYWMHYCAEDTNDG